MDLKQLSYFVKIVEEGSISAAAKKLFMSQPPLSSQMKLLEEELNCTLFERGARTIHLTEAGQTLYNYSCSLLKLSSIAKQETISAANHFNGIIRIGIVSSIMCSHALNWLNGFSQAHPDIHYEIKEGDTYQLVSQFETNAIHLALLRTPFNSSGLICKKIFTDSLVVIGDQKFFANPQTPFITLSELSHMPLIMYRRWEHIIKKKFDEENLTANYFCINDDARTTLNFVETGMGVGFIPESAAALTHKKGIICKNIQNCEILTDVVLAYNSTAYLPECSKEFIRYIETLH